MRTSLSEILTAAPVAKLLGPTARPGGEAAEDEELLDVIHADTYICIY